ncbi:MAG: SRPBCC family protein [Halalkalicoccus sp.]
MREVEVTVTLDAPPEAVERALTPASIVGYAGTYTVESVEREADRTVVSASAGEIETVLEFGPREDGYVYSQRGTEGPFEEMHSRIVVEGTEEGTRVIARSAFTFGGWSAFVTDWLGADVRRDELQRLLYELAADLADGTD